MPGARSGRRRWSGWLLAPPRLTMAALGAWGIGRGWSWDEVASVSSAGRSWSELWALTRHVDVVHLVYYAFLHLWLSVGSGEAWSHLPSVLAAVASAGLVAALGARLAGDRAGLLAGLVFATMPFVSFYAQTTRSYALVCACVLAATYCLVRGLAAAGPGWWVGYAGAMTLALVLHEMTAPVLLAHGLTLLVVRPPPRVWLSWLAGAAVAVLALAPIAWTSLGQSGQLDWMSPRTWGTVADLVSAFLGPTPVVMVVLGALVLLGLAAPARDGVRVAAVAVPLLVVPPAALLLASLAHPLYRERYVLSSIAGMALLAGAGLDRLVTVVAARGSRPARGPIAWGVPVVLVALLLALQLPAQRHTREPSARIYDLAGAARVVAAGARPGDGVVFTRPFFRASAIGYPASYADTTDVSLARTPVASASLLGTEKRPRDVRAALAGYDRVWVVGRLGRNAREGGGVALVTQQVMAADFTARRTTRVPGVVVTLYVRDRAAPVRGG